jgi:hypothetical protein
MAELARFQASFATLEMSLNVLFAFALGKPQTVAEAILSRIKSIGDRIKIIEAAAGASSDLTRVQKLSVEIACERAAALNNRRNIYAHGLYEHRGETIRVTPYAFANNKRQPEILKLVRVQSDVALIDEVLMSTMLYAGLVPDAVLNELLGTPEEPQPPVRAKKPRS